MENQVVTSQFPTPPLRANSLAELLFGSLEENPKRTCIINTEIARKWTNEQVLESALSFAQYLRDDCYLKSGDIVFFVCENSDIHAIALIGVILAGGVYASAPFSSTIYEVNELVALMKPWIVVTDMALKGDFKVVSIKTVEEVFKIEREKDKRFPWKQSLDDVTTLVLSSGSTGVPKTIKKTHRNIMATMAGLEHQELMPVTQKDIYLSVNFCHSSGQRSVFTAVTAGAALAIVQWDENHEKVFDSIHKFGVTMGFLVPTQLNWLVKSGYSRDRINCLQDVRTGGASLSAQMHMSLEKNFLKFRNSYGLSECGPVLMTPLSAKFKNRETVGKVVPGFTVQVIDINGNPLSANNVGEICLKGDQMTPGYLNKEKESSKLFTKDGFMRTGDLGFYDEELFFFIVGRLKDIIKVDGVSVAPAELENLLLRHKDVTSAAVIGIEDDLRGQVPMAFVTLAEGVVAKEEALITWFEDRVNDYKKLRGGLRILQEMPKTHSGKISKTSLLTSVLA